MIIWLRFEKTDVICDLLANAKFTFAVEETWTIF